MQNTTADYKLEINKPSRSFECKITIGDNIYNNEDIVNMTFDYPQSQDGFSIGTTISQTLDLTLLTITDIIYSTSQIKVEIGLKIGSNIEYILMGYYNIDEVEKTDYTIKFTAYDNMIKFETAYFSELGDKPTLQQVVNELEKKTGIKFTGSLPAYTVSKLEGFSCREVLSYVASICGGNALITRDGKFTIKGLAEVSKSIDGNNYFDYKHEEVKYKLGQISCQVGESLLTKGSIGTDSMELGFENPWVTENILNDIYNKLNGLEYLGYSMKWQGDLSLDPGDIITATDIKNVTRKIPILAQSFSYTGGLTSDIGAKGETKNKNSFSSNGSTTNKVNRVVMEQAIIKEALIEKANIKDLEVSNAKIENLQVKTASIESAIIGVAYISDLTAINANISSLFAADATINTALIGKADITELNAVQGNITSLNSQIANIQTLVNGNLSSENIQAGGITGVSLNMDTIFVKDANMINVNINALKAGDISTNKFRIVSDNGGIEIVGATQQFKDRNNKVRIQMGQDAAGNFNFILRGEDGTSTLIDHTGIKPGAIADGLIVNDMIGDGEIGGKKIDISSMITEINKDTNTSIIKSSKVQLDTLGQTLEVAFNSLKTQSDSTKNELDNLEIGDRNLWINKEVMSYKGGGLAYKQNININGYEVKVEGNPLDIVGCKINNLGKKLYVSGKTTLNIVNVYYKFDNSNQFNKNIITNNGFFEFYLDVPSNSLYLNLGLGEYPYISPYTISYINVKSSTKEVDWTPAPEDISDKINSVKEITESNSTTISVMQGQISAAINNTQIVKDGQTILLKDDYNRTVATVNSINSTIGSHKTLIDANSGNITSVDTKVNTVQRDLEGTKSIVTSHTAQINGLNSTVSTQGSSISQLQNQITLKVEQSDVSTAIDSITIGGKNLIIDTSQMSVENGWTYNGTGYSFEVDSNTSNRIVKNKSNGSENWIGSPSINVVAGIEYTITIKAKSEGLDLGLQIPIFYDGGWNNYIYFNKDTNGEYITKSFTIKPTQNGELKVALDNNKNKTGYVWYHSLKVEKGNKVTDWTPSPEDVDSSISKVDGKLTTTSNKVASIETALDSITTRVSSTETSTATINATLTTTTNTANTAKNTADIANSNAQTAQNTANAANDLAGTANNTANIANSLANTNKGNISTLDGKITTTNNKVAEISTSVDKITQRVSSTETTTATINATLNTTTNTANSALITANNANNKIDGLQIGGRNILKFSRFNNGIVDSDWICQGKLTGGIVDPLGKNNACYITVTQTNSYLLKEYRKIFPKIGQYTLSVWLKGSKEANFNIQLQDKVNQKTVRLTTAWKKFELVGNITDINCQYEIVFGGWSSWDTSLGVYIAYPMLVEGNKAMDWTPAPEDTEESINKISVEITTTKNQVSSIETNLNNITSRVSATETVTTTINGKITNHESRINTAEQKITATAIVNTISETINNGTASINTVSTVLDRNGLTINNGAIRIRNNSGTNVLEADVNGNLILTGTAKSQSGDRWVGLDSGGLTFQDYHRNEQMLRVALSSFSSARDMNGVSFALPQYSDYLRFQHIAKSDLSNGWTSSDTSYTFMDMWSGTHTINGYTNPKGITVYSPLYAKNKLNLYSGNEEYPSTIEGGLGWNGITGMLGLAGDNGCFLGYKSGSTVNGRLILTEAAHPGTGDHIRSYGNWNASANTIHNAHLNGLSLTVSGSKNCIQKTKNYGERLINAYETAEYYFGDIGSGKINGDGECLIYIDDIFQECVNTDIEYHVFTQVYNGAIKTVERFKTYFVIKGDPGTNFSWELKAKRLGYENNRLDVQDDLSVGESGLELFGEEDFKVNTSEELLNQVLDFNLEDLLLMEG